MIYNPKNTPEIEALISTWQDYIATLDDWQELTQGTTPKQTDCGPVYEPPSPLSRPRESFAIADMREVKVAQPHYHAGGETEIYFIISGSGLTVVGGEELPITAGDIIVTPPNTAHFTIPKENLVMIVINTPPFNPNNNISIEMTDPEVKYDHAQYQRLAGTPMETPRMPTHEHESQAQLSARLKEAAERVTVGARYMHYKQLSYTVLALALREEDNEPCVVYQAEYGERITFIRPVASWTEEVEANGQKVRRFAKI